MTEKPIFSQLTRCRNKGDECNKVATFKV